jgi:hypothetical protein
MSNRLQVEIKSDHTKARLSLDGYELELPLQSWSVNGGLSLTIPWEWVDLYLRHPDTESEPFIPTGDLDPFLSPKSAGPAPRP